MKRIAFVLSSFLFVALAHAASFDCEKAGTKVEHIICDNPEISKRDEDMEAAYKAALQDPKQANSIRASQKRWLKDRDACGDASCVWKAYQERLSVLPESYILEMSKNPKLCNAIQDLFNDDVKSYGNVRYDKHQIFTKLWQRVVMDEASHPASGCMQLWRGIFDINNDGKSELVIKRSACLSGSLNDSLFVYPNNSDVLAINPQTKKLNPLENTDNEFDKRIYCLKGQHACLGGHFSLNPFTWGNVSYINITDHDHRWIDVAKYKHAGKLEDICYLLDPNVAD